MERKIKIALLALLALTLTGCEAETKEQRDERYSYDIEVITYKGHDYIVLSATKYCNGITHDPDCPCREKGDDVIMEIDSNGYIRDFDNDLDDIFDDEED